MGARWRRAWRCAGNVDLGARFVRFPSVPGQPRELRRKAARHASPRPVVTAPRFFPASSVPSGELDGPDVTTVTPLSTAGRGHRLEEGNKQESEKAEAIYQAVGVGSIGDVRISSNLYP